MSLKTLKMDNQLILIIIIVAKLRIEHLYLKTFRKMGISQLRLGTIASSSMLKMESSLLNRDILSMKVIPFLVILVVLELIHHLGNAYMERILMNMF